MTFLCYDKCTTCKKSKKMAGRAGRFLRPAPHQGRKSHGAGLRAWHEISGLPLKKFFNTSGLQYKALGLKDKLPAMSEDEQIALLATDGMLVKRPMLIGDDFVLVGFKEADWAQKV